MKKFILFNLLAFLFIPSFGQHFVHCYKSLETLYLSAIKNGPNNKGYYEVELRGKGEYCGVYKSIFEKLKKKYSFTTIEVWEQTCYPSTASVYYFSFKNPVTGDSRVQKGLARMDKDVNKKKLKEGGKYAGFDDDMDKLMSIIFTPNSQTKMPKRFKNVSWQVNTLSTIGDCKECHIKELMDLLGVTIIKVSVPNGIMPKELFFNYMSNSNYYICKAYHHSDNPDFISEYLFQKNSVIQEKLNNDRLAEKQKKELEEQKRIQAENERKEQEEQKRIQAEKERTYKYNMEVLGITEKPTIEWVEIPSGTFYMGTDGEQGFEAYDNEAPRHKVTLSAFKMSKYEITFDQYDMFCYATGRSLPDDGGWGRGARPVINVSCVDAFAFAEWMGCRLPTEAEWEYACRAGTSTAFNTGTSLSTSQANYGGGHAEGFKFVYTGKTMPVGSYAPNSWGLYDMHGNVKEWCSDWYQTYYYKNSPEVNPQGPSTYQGGPSYFADAVAIVVRGGDWASDSWHCRSTIRDYLSPIKSSWLTGFRLVMPVLEIEPIE